ncbi:MAG: carboxylating nicotinate-nucleotide diphosphorylase [Candidatus Krumholzibacteria bacterium]|nr:carboxylating nicotinate-nucleotide diphosphorylase [Candidatus Krumholzibacteria bacterium]
MESGFPREEWVETLVRQALAEDVGHRDVSTAISVDPSAMGRGDLVSRDNGVVAGLPLLKLVYGLVDPAVSVEPVMADGTPVAPDSVVARLEGPLGSILTGERTALNFLQNLGGIASLTARYVAEVSGTSCRVLDTRKTLPGYRSLAKYAVLCGGGHNHRMGLYDRVMLKDNHWTAAAVGIEEMVVRARREFPDLAIEVEVDTLDQLDQVLPLGVDWILLDNFTVVGTADAVARRDAAPVKTLLESSGNITLESIAGYARVGVDGASVGRLTHSAGALDLGLDLERR